MNIEETVRACAPRWNCVLRGQTKPVIVTDMQMPRPNAWHIYYCGENVYGLARVPFTDEIFRPINELLKIGELEPLGKFKTSTGTEVEVDGFLCSPGIHGEWRWKISLRGPSILTDERPPVDIIREPEAQLMVRAEVQAVLALSEQKAREDWDTIATSNDLPATAAALQRLRGAMSEWYTRTGEPLSDRLMGELEPAYKLPPEEYKRLHFGRFDVAAPGADKTVEHIIVINEGPAESYEPPRALPVLIDWSTVPVRPEPNGEAPEALPTERRLIEGGSF